MNVYSLLALAGIVGPIVLGVTDLVAGVFEPKYNLARDSISNLALTPMDWLQTIGFLAIGLLVEVFAAGLLFSIRARRGFRFGIARVTVNLKELLLQMLPPDPEIPEDRQQQWQQWLSELEKRELWHYGEPKPAPQPQSVYRYQFSLHELMNLLPWYLGSNDFQTVMNRLTLGGFYIPVTVTDRWGNEVGSNISLTIVDTMQPLKVGWNLVSTPVKLDDAFATWEDIFYLGDGISILFELHEPGVDLPDVPRFNWQPVFITDYNRYTDDAGTHTYIKYQDDRIGPIEVFKFYQGRMGQGPYYWQFDGGECQPDHAWLNFHRTDNKGKTYNCSINANEGVIQVWHASAPVEEPTYGGVFNMGWSIPPSFFDEALGSIISAPTLYLTNEELLMGDWTKGPAGSYQATWLYSSFPTPSTLKGCLAGSWEMPDPQTLIFHIRPGVKWQNKPPVNGRELTANDVVFSLKRLWTTPTSSHYTRYPWADHFQVLDGGPWIKALDKYTVQIKCLPGKLPWVYEMASDRSKIVPPEAVGVGLNNWQNACGTGPFMLTDYASDNSSATFVRNPNYWMKDPRRPENTLPYLDGVKYFISDNSSIRIAALREGTIDWLGGPQTAVQWQDAQSLMTTNPELKYLRYLPASTMAIFMRTDNATSPFNDIRVRRALAMGIDNEAIKNSFYGGNAEILTSPIAPVPEFMDMYTPLDQLPQSTRELYGYNPDKAKQLLAEAGYPTGFTTEIICNSTQVDMASIVKAYWAAIGVNLTINVKSLPTWTATGRDKTYTQMYMGTMVSHLPFEFYNYRPGAPSNYSLINDSTINAAITEIDAAYFNESGRRQLMKELVPYILDRAYILPMPEPYVYNFWQPWVRGYHGEVSIGKLNHDFARYIWIDQDMKDAMTGE